MKCFFSTINFFDFLLILNVKSVDSITIRNDC